MFDQLPDGMWHCAECGKTHKKDRWNNSKAQGLGWFMQKDGTAWCPDHIPEWVAEWRANRSYN